MRADVKRRIAYTQNWHMFCNKYNILISPLTEDSICEALKYLAASNELKRADNKEGYVKMTAYFKDIEIVNGYFTVKQIDDIMFLDNRIKMC